MQILMTIGTLLVAIFSGCVGVYIVSNQWGLRNKATRIAVSSLVGVITFVITMAIGIMVIWPPILPL